MVEQNPVVTIGVFNDKINCHEEYLYKVNITVCVMPDVGVLQQN